MLEISKGVFIVKSKILTMKVVNKDGKWWVVFHCGKLNGEDQSVFSADHGTEENAKAFLNACANSL